jgi:PTS system nitrogen regulatory IIA component
MVEFLFENEVIFSRERFFDSILTREKMMSTGIGKKLAIPHARSEAVKELTIAVYLLQNELEFDAIDDEPVKIILMIAVPENMKEKYMLVLSAISNFFQDIENYRKLLNCNSNEEAVNLLRTIERKI